MNQLKIEANGKWASILSLFIDKEFLTGKHTPCPLCGGKDRFRFDNKNGEGTYICSQCGAGTGIHLLSQHQGIQYKEAWRIVEKTIGFSSKIESKPECDKKKRILDILESCTPLTENIIGYLNSRHIYEIPESLQAGEYWLDGVLTDCMVAKAAKGNKLAGLHLTFIRGGKKLTRKMYSVEEKSMNGSAIRLHKINVGDAIVIGEGIETTLSASVLTGLPGWAAMDAGKMELIEIPEQIKMIVIAGDNDKSFTGQAAAYNLAKRLTLQGKIVEVIIPEKIGDFNDYANQP